MEIYIKDDMNYRTKLALIRLQNALEYKGLEFYKFRHSHRINVAKLARDAGVSSKFAFRELRKRGL